MDILNTKIKSILTEKTNKVRPENIKSGISILGISGNVVELNGETKTITPTTSQQTITPSQGKNGITQATIEAVTSSIDANITAGNIKKDVTILNVTGTYEGIDTSDANAVANDIVTGKTAYVNGQKLTGTYTGIIPTGTKSITQNGTVDVSNYASANVSVPTPTPNLQSKSVTITENGTTTITADSGYDGLDEVEVTTNVSGGGSQAVLPNGIKFGTYASTNSDMSWLSNVDTSNLTTMARMFYSCENLVTVAFFDTSNVTDMDNLFYGCTSLVTAPEMDTSNVTMIRSLFYGCTSLVNVPVYNIESATSFGNMFSNCSNLSNESLNHILAMCASLTATVTLAKTLKKIGLSQSQATTCTGLSNWASAQSAGWTTGY